MSKATNPTPLERLRTVLYDGGRQPRGIMPSTVQGPLGEVPGAGIDTAREPVQPRQLSERQQQAVMQAELVSAIHSLVDSTTEITARLGRRGAMNGVIDVWGGQFPASGLIQRTYEIAVGSLVIVNLDAATTITVQSGVPAGDTGVQAAGTGVQYVLPLQRHIMPVGDRSFTISGPAGTRIGYQAFTGLQPFGVSAL
jgi:hypothetical protein